MAMTAEERLRVRAERERKRRERVKHAQEVVARYGGPERAELTAEQRDRAMLVYEGNVVASGDDVLLRYVMEGRDPATPAPATGPELTDEQAKALARDAKALGQGRGSNVNSNFLLKDARCFAEFFEVVGKGLVVTVRRRDDHAVVHAFDLGVLEAYAAGGSKDKAVRAALTKLSTGTRLWGRKLGLFILASV